MGLFFSILFTVGITDPYSWFGSQYTDALTMCREQKTIFTNTFPKSGSDPALVLSVAFPEMLRYTLWKDVLETTALEVLYIDHGAGAADFSIGWFQMKPSFAEGIEQRILINTKAMAIFSQLVLNKDDLPAEQRRKRVARLKDMKWQAEYLSAFVWLASAKLDSASAGTGKRLQYLSALYNKGLDCSLKEIDQFLLTRTFPYGPGRENPFSYSELATFFFSHDASKIFTNTKQQTL